MGSQGGPASTPPPSEESAARAKPVARPALPSEAPGLIPARMVNEVLYCERLFYLEWAQGEFADNVYTIDGRATHRRADRPGGALPPRAKAASSPRTPFDDEGEPAEERPYKARAVTLSSEKLGVIAKIDVVEGAEDGTVIPIEYKRGAAPHVPEGAWLPERAQLCVHVLLLREHGYRCEEAALYFARNKRRVPIVIDDTLVAQTHAAIARAKEIAAAGELPPPLVASPKCVGCSLAPICLPDEIALLSRSAPSNRNDAVAANLDDAPEGKRTRLLHPSRDDKLPVYVQTQGARVGLDGEVLSIKSPDGETTEAKLPQTSQVCLVGNVQISTQALRDLLSCGIPISFFTGGGYFVGRAVGHDSKNIELRIAQHRAADDPAFCLALARGLVAAKIRNCRTMLRRNHEGADPVTLGELEQLAKKAESADSIASLLGLEGTAARSYFGAFGGMLSRDMGFELEGRNRRPPKDRVNALLSLAYALLAKDFTIALTAVGFDAHRGYFHQPRFGRPSLALDLMEEFRPLVCDSTVLSVINGGILGLEDFQVHPVGVSLTQPARRRFIQAYERRMESLVTHPLFGYRISYRRVLEVQARLLSRLLFGEIPSYPHFRTR